MHGLIFHLLQDYVTKNYGAPAWTGLLQESGLGQRVYLTSAVYPDEELVSLVAAACQKTGRAAGDVVEDFGHWITGDLIKMYATLIKPEWKTLDLIEITENTIHTVVRAQDPAAKPPELHVARISLNELVIFYTSSRKLCALAVGITKGIAEYYHEQVAVSQPKCMLRGDTACEIRVQVV